MEKRIRWVNFGILCLVPSPPESQVKQGFLRSHSFFPTLSPTVLASHAKIKKMNFFLNADEKLLRPS